MPSGNKALPEPLSIQILPYGFTKPQYVNFGMVHLCLEYGLCYDANILGLNKMASIFKYILFCDSYDIVVKITPMIIPKGSLAKSQYSTR